MCWVFFFFLPNLSYFESERRNEKQSLSTKRWYRGDVLIYPALQLFIKACSMPQPPGAPHLTVTLAASIYILFVTYRGLEPAQHSQCGQNKWARSKISLGARFRLGYFFKQGFPSWVIGRTEQTVCFSLKPLHSQASSD